MVVRIEEQHVEMYLSIADEINRAVKKFSHRSYEEDPKKYEGLLMSTSMSVERKKEELISRFHKLMIKTFSIHTERVDKKRIIKGLKNNIAILRLLVGKLRDINYYLETSFLEELGLIKPIDLEKHSLENKEYLGKKEKEQLEHTIYRLIERIISLDNKLLAKYKRNEEKVVKGEKLEVTDLEKVLKKESELLSHIEAKLPPVSTIRESLLSRKGFTVWSSIVLALVSAFENEYRKEQDLFGKLRQNRKAKSRLDIKISHIVNEKLNVLKLKEKRLLSWEKAAKVEKEHRKAAFHFALASRL